MVKCQTHMFRKIIILYNNIRIVVTGVVKCQTNIIIYNYMACIAFVGSLSAHLITFTLSTIFSLNRVISVEIHIVF